MDVMDKGMIEERRENILRVTASADDIKKSYGALSGIYGHLEGRFEKKLRQRLLNLLRIQRGEVVLEIGFGTGFSLLEIAHSVGSTGKVFGLDLTPQMICITERRINKAGLQNRAELYEGDAREMPFEDSMFDVVYMASTLELFDTPDIPVVLGETRRVLKEHGRLGIASLSKEGRENFWVVKIYEWIHRTIPRYATCRPIYLDQAINNARFDIVQSRELMIMNSVPMKLVLAKPAG